MDRVLLYGDVKVHDVGYVIVANQDVFWFEILV